VRLGRHVVPTLLGLALIAMLVAVRIADPYPVKVARDTAFDFLQQLAPRPKADLPVRIVDIDDASLKAIGQWPWPRSELATLTSRLTELGAAAIGFDMLFPEADRLSPSRLMAGVPPPPSATAVAAGAATPTPLPDYDQQFADALGKAPSILGFAVSPDSGALPLSPKVGFAISGTDPSAAIPHIGGAVLPLVSLGDAAHGLGGLSLDTRDRADVVREVPLVWISGKQLYPSLALEALRMALGVDTIVVLGDTAGQGYVEGVRVGDITIPTTASGNLTLYYAKPDPSLYVSARDILGPDYTDLKPLIQGQIVLIGTSASGLLDLHTTPLGDNVPGVSIHAQAIQQVLGSSFLVRSDWVSGFEVFGFALIGLIIVGFVLRVGPLAGLVIGVGLLAVTIAGSWFLFRRYGLLVDPSFPLVGSFVLYSAMVFLRFVTTDADRRQIRRAFGHYVAPALLAEIETSRDRLKLGGELREVTVMFADMRNFTSISEDMAPAELLSMLNTLFGALGGEVIAQYGTIDKFIGDALMAFWNAPVDVADHPRKACLAALGMRARLAALNAQDGFGRLAAGRQPATIAIGIGISTGEALVGNMGLESRFDYSCLGDTVNTASRVEGACKAVGYDVTVVEETRAAAFDLAFLEAGALQLKGKAARERIHILVGDALLARSASFQALSSAHDTMIYALRQGRQAEEAIAACKALAEAVEPRLAAFYEMIAKRPEDFRSAMPA
jgi:adenylate cyclase